MTTKKLKKRQKLRNNEYYDIQDEFDELYRRSKQGSKFNNLLELIASDQNILLAYRNIKKNKGSKTRGSNRTTIIDTGRTDPGRLLQYVKNRLQNYSPQPVRRKEIEKEDGRMRPLGIPTIEDRLIQQCIKQVLEPICEAKFYEHSYGFRPNRGTHHAIARVNFLAYKAKLQYVVDIDIKGFFDNVNHAKLMKQMWSIGIQDKNLLCIISKMLKAEIKGIGIPTKGTPQGGILSPLLSNIVLNELDWWINSQWEGMPTNHQYANKSKKVRALKNTGLKEVYIVRYADDFKLLCRTRESASKLFCAVKDWLNKRLSLEISSEKSKIVNLKRQYSEFLGIRIKLQEKGKLYVTTSRMTEKSVRKSKKKLKNSIDTLQKQPTADNMQKLNACILGLHNYYCVATNVARDFDKIAFQVNANLKNTRPMTTQRGQLTKSYTSFYGHYTGRPKFIMGIPLFPIHLIKFRPPPYFDQKKCNYTIEGRNKLHNPLQAINTLVLRYLMEYPVELESTEFNDNRISLFVGQQGKCFITGTELATSTLEVHRKIPKKNGGTDEYGNLVIVLSGAHKLIHALDEEVVQECLMALRNSNINYKRLNQLRIMVGNSEICVG
ncbi:group II intron reverse transcriptase/maturase [Desulfitispora alkaliphila]|uniref:group II intron reverse transcriptase/maturase n=1 Tax=Desulfitispora alkaliphila TaxID=622674 RepID=UPI003D22ED64